MRVKLCDLVEVATDDISAWFDACETPGDCRALARDLKDMVDSVAECRAGFLAETGSEDGACR